MRESKKIVLTALTILALVAASPLAAQLAGVWEGTGTGFCYPRNSVVIYPWHEWKGEIPNSQDVFEGDWWDHLGNHGTFKGEVEFSPIPEIAYAKGAWYWYDPLGPASRPKYGGDFEMTFWFLEGKCEGIWTTIWPSPGAIGTMEGERVEP